ncbi:MAG: hypothetical protein HOP28_04700 [Gemmatimonadales bacterium]|nr:hypothetical protein [Gemmatimonadales bacterium]
MALGSLAASAMQAQTLRLPSEVLHDISKGRLENLRWTPNEVEAALKPLLQNVRTTDLPAEEEVALGLAYYFTFDGLSARPLFEKHMAREDRLGRVSWQSLQQMSFFGAKDYALVERRLKEYRRKFRPTLDDREYTYSMTNNLARNFASQGDHPRAVALILEDVQALPLGAPYRSFELLGVHFASFQAAGQVQVAIDWIKRHRDALRSAGPLSESAKAAAARTAINAADLRLPHRAGVIHVNFTTDLLYQDDPNITLDDTVQYARARTLAKFERWAAAAEKGEPITPS